MLRSGRIASMRRLKERQWNPMGGQVRPPRTGAVIPLSDMLAMVNPPVPPESLLQSCTDWGGNGAEFVQQKIVPARYRTRATGTRNPHHADNYLCFSETEMTRARKHIANFIHGDRPRPPRSADPAEGDGGGAPPVFESETAQGTRLVFSAAHAAFADRFLRVFPGHEALAEAAAVVAGCGDDGASRERWLRRFFRLDRRTVAEAAERVAAGTSVGSEPEATPTTDASDEGTTAITVRPTSTVVRKSELPPPPPSHADWEVDNDAPLDLDDDGGATVPSAAAAGVEAQYAAVYDSFAAFCHDAPHAARTLPGFGPGSSLAVAATMARRRELLLLLATGDWHLLPAAAPPADRGAATPLVSRLAAETRADLAALDAELRTRRLHVGAVRSAVAEAADLSRRKQPGITIAPPSVSPHDRITDPS